MEPQDVDHGLRYGEFPNDGTETHEFLFGYDAYQINAGARAVPTMREFIEARPETSATFTLSTVDGVPTNLDTIFVEMAGAWEISDRFGHGSKRLFAHPHGIDSARYSDSVVECECGALVAHVRPGGTDSELAGPDHADDCTVAARDEARERLAAKREAVLRHCMALGWSTGATSARLGGARAGGGGRAHRVADRAGTTITELRNAYREVAGRTYVKLVHEYHAPAEVAEGVYDQHKTTLGQWARKYADIRVGRGRPPRTTG